MNSKISRRTAIALLGAGAAALAMKPAMGADPTLLRTGLIPIAPLAPYYAADKRGFFAAEGIAVTTQPVQTGAVGLPALMSGSFDILYTNTVSVLTALERGLDVRILMETTRVPAAPPENSSLFRRRDAAIARGRDLEGKAVAINSRYTISELILDRWVKRDGGDVSKMNFREIPVQSMLDALKSGQADVAFMQDPFIRAALKDEAVEEFAYPTTSVIPGLSTAVWVVGGKWADANADVTQAFRRAYLKGGEWVNANMGKPEYFELVSSFTKLDPKLIADLPRVPQQMDTDPAAINGIGDLMLEFGQLKSKIDVSQYVFK